MECTEQPSPYRGLGVGAGGEDTKVGLNSGNQELPISPLAKDSGGNLLKLFFLKNIFKQGKGPSFENPGPLEEPRSGRDPERLWPTLPMVVL